MPITSLGVDGCGLNSDAGLRCAASPQAGYQLQLSEHAL